MAFRWADSAPSAVSPHIIILSDFIADRARSPVSDDSHFFYIAFGKFHFRVKVLKLCFDAEDAFAEGENLARIAIYLLAI
jgi:hypothetical protein